MKFIYVIAFVFMVYFHWEHVCRAHTQVRTHGFPHVVAKQQLVAMSLMLRTNPFGVGLFLIGYVLGICYYLSIGAFVNFPDESTQAFGCFCALLGDIYRLVFVHRLSPEAVSEWLGPNDKVDDESFFRHVLLSLVAVVFVVVPVVIGYKVNAWVAAACARAPVRAVAEAQKRAEHQ